MTLFAVDLTSEYGSFALRRDGRTVAEVDVRSPTGFGHLVFPCIERLLESAGVTLTDIDCFAAANGPGSFTGVRVGLGAVKGLAEAMGRPVAGVSNLRAMASFGTQAKRVVILDARRSQVFAAVYDVALELVCAETVTKLEGWLERLEFSDGEFIWFAGASFSAVVEGTRFAAMPMTEAPRNLAAAVAICAEMDAGRGRWMDPAALDANYVRQSDAELFWKDS